MKWILQHPTTLVLIFATVLATVLSAEAKSTKVRKTQEVNFSEMNLKGTIRNPDGAYLVQKRGLKFQPLYKIQEDFDVRIRETSLYVN